MYTLKEFWQLRNLPMPAGAWDGNIICTETDAEMTFGTNDTHGFLLCYTFTIITQGKLTIVYNDREMTLHKGDLYTYSPGFEVNVRSATSNYRGICLLADEHFTLSQPSVRNAIRTSYYTVVELTSPVLSLKSDEQRRLCELMQMMIHYQRMDLPQANDSLRMLYNLFLTDLSSIQHHSIIDHRFPKRVEELFFSFLHLLPQHFLEHHDIGYYASELCITPTYLSRVVRQVSGGRTVIDYINKLLLMEATFLLSQTPLSIAQIADRPHFAETTTFARFFQRLKGMTPREYRKRK